MRIINLTKSLLLSTALVSVVGSSFASDPRREEDGKESTNKFVGTPSSQNSNEALLKIAAPLLTGLEQCYKEQTIKVLAGIPENEREAAVKLAVPFIKVSPYYPMYIVEAMSKVPAVDREEILKLAQPFIEMDVSAVVRYISGISEIPKKNREEVLKLAKSFLEKFSGQTLNNVNGQFSPLVKAINAVVSHDREDVLKLAAPFIKEQPWNTPYFIEAISKVHKDDRDDVLRRAKPFMSDKYSDAVFFIEVISKIHKDDRDDVLRRAEPFMSYKYSNANYFIEAISKVPVEDRDDVLRRAMPFFMSDGYEAKFIIEAISKVSAVDREDVFKLAEPFIKEDLYKGLGFLEAISKVSKDDRKMVLDLTESFMKEKLNYGNQVNKDHVKGFIEGLNTAINQISKDDREQVLRLAAPFMKAGYDASIISSISEIPAADREDVLRLFGTIINEKMYAERITKAISKVPKEDREQVLRLAAPFMKAGYDTSIISTISGIPADDREDVLRLFGTIINEKMYAERIIEAISKVPAADREDVLRLAASLAKEHRNYTDYFIEAISKVPAADREDVLRLAAPLTKEAPYSVYTIIRPLGRVPAADREQVLRITVPFINVCEDAGYLIEQISKVPVEDRDDVLKNTEILLKEKKNFSSQYGISSYKIIEHISKLYKNDRPILVEQATSILRKAKSLNLPIYYTTFEALLSMSKVPLEHMDNIFQQATDLVDEKTNISVLASILDVFSTLSDEEITSVKKCYLKWIVPLAKDNLKFYEEFCAQKAGWDHDYYGRGIAIKIIAELPADDREYVLEKMCSLLTHIKGNYYNGSHLVSEFFPVISEIRHLPKDDREDILEKAELIIKDKAISFNNSLELFRVISEIREIPKGDRADVAKRTLDFIADKGIKGSEEIFDIISSISAITPAERDDVMGKAKKYSKEITDGSGLFNILIAVSSTPADQRGGKVLDDFMDLIKNKKSPSHDSVSPITTASTSSVASASMPMTTASTNEDSDEDEDNNDSILSLINAIGILPPELFQQGLYTFIDLKKQDLKIFKENLTSSGKALNFLISQDLSLKDKIYNHWKDALTKTTDIYKTRRYVNIITDEEEVEDLGLTEEHDLVQLALRVGTLVESSTDPMNPFNFYKTTEEKSKQPVAWDKIKPAQETIDGYSFHFNIKFLKEELPKYSNSLTFEQLPKYSKGTLKTISEALQERAKEEAVNNAIQSMTGLTYDVLIERALSDGYLQRKLDIEGQKGQEVPLITARFIAMTAYIESLSPQKEEGKLFSLQEEGFLKMLASIGGCSYGKGGGVNGYYLNVLPESFKLKAANTKIDDEISYKDLLVVCSMLQENVEKMFTGQNLFAKSLINMRHQEEVNEATHQALYLKNVIGHEVGLKHGIKFDIHSNLFYKDLVDRSKDEVMQAFYKYFLPSDFANKALEYYKGKQIFEDYPDVIEHLAQLGIVTITKKPE